MIADTTVSKECRACARFKGRERTNHKIATAQIMTRTSSLRMLNRELTWHTFAAAVQGALGIAHAGIFIGEA